MSASVTVMDPIALTLIQKYGGEFGRERLFSTVGMAIFSPLTGILIDYKSSQEGAQIVRIFLDLLMIYTYENNSSVRYNDPLLIKTLYLSPPRPVSISSNRLAIRFFIMKQRTITFRVYSRLLFVCVLPLIKYYRRDKSRGEHVNETIYRK